VRALGILLFRCWHAYHAAGLVITPEIGRKHAQHAVRIEPVRFSPSGAAVDENAGGFKNMVDDTMCRQQTVQPEAVTSRLKAADNAYRRFEPASSTGPLRRDQSQQGGRVATIDPILWSGRALQEVFVELTVSGLASMYPAFDLEHLLRAIMDISARAFSLADRPQRAIRVTSVRKRREDRTSISTYPLADLGG